MAGNKKILSEDRSKVKNASVTDKKEKVEKKYDNEKLSVDNKRVDNSNLKNTGENIKEEIKKNESTTIPEQKITDIRAYGTDKDYIVVELVGTYRNIWNLLTRHDQIRRVKEDSKDLEIIPIEYEFGESKEVEFLLSQTKNIFLNGVTEEINLENLLIFANKHGDILNDAMLDLIIENKESVKKYRAKIIKIITLGQA